MYRLNVNKVSRIYSCENSCKQKFHDFYIDIFFFVKNLVKLNGVRYVQFECKQKFHDLFQD